MSNPFWKKTIMLAAAKQKSRAKYQIASKEFGNEVRCMLSMHSTDPCSDLLTDWVDCELIYTYPNIITFIVMIYYTEY